MSQLERIEALLNTSNQRLSELEIKVSRACPGASIDSRAERVSALLRNRFPRADCKECDGIGVVTCGYCGGDGDQVRCYKCNGTGTNHGSKEANCSNCFGSGRVNCFCEAFTAAGKVFCSCVRTSKETRQYKGIEFAMKDINDKAIDSFVSSVIRYS